jgi:hypothetical protein
VKSLFTPLFSCASAFSFFTLSHCFQCHKNWKILWSLLFTIYVRLIWETHDFFIAHAWLYVAIANLKPEQRNMSYLCNQFRCRRERDRDLLCLVKSLLWATWYCDICMEKTPHICILGQQWCNSRKLIRKIFRIRLLTPMIRRIT